MRGFRLTPGLTDELTRLLTAVTRPGNRYVSRSAMLGEIAASPGKYPQLSAASQKHQKYLISYYMKPRYLPWGGEQSRIHQPHVWIIGEAAA